MLYIIYMYHVNYCTNKAVWWLLVLCLNLAESRHIRWMGSNKWLCKFSFLTRFEFDLEFIFAKLSEQLISCYQNKETSCFLTFPFFFFFVLKPMMHYCFGWNIAERNYLVRNIRKNIIPLVSFLILLATFLISSSV